MLNVLKAEFTLETDVGVAPEAITPESTGQPEANGGFCSLDPNNIRAERIASLIFAAILLSAGIIALPILWWNLGFGLIWYCIAAAVSFLVLVTFWFAFSWPATEHRHASWRLDEEGLEIRRGVFWKHQITIPLGRVQHADVSQGPLQRPFGLGTLTIHTAGTQNASVELKGLAHDTAIQVRDEIVRQRKDQHVV